MTDKKKKTFTGLSNIQKQKLNVEGYKASRETEKKKLIKHKLDQEKFKHASKYIANYEQDRTSKIWNKYSKGGKIKHFRGNRQFD